MIPREPPAVCLGCGHTRPWHSTGNGCTHEVRDKMPNIWKRCGCEGWKV